MSMRRQVCSAYKCLKNGGSKTDVAGLKPAPRGLGLPVFARLFKAALRGNGPQLSGTIADATGAILAGAQISVVNEANGIRRVARSNQEGGYAVGSRSLDRIRSPFVATAFRRWLIWE